MGQQINIVLFHTTLAEVINQIHRYHDLLYLYIKFSIRR